MRNCAAALLASILLAGCFTDVPRGAEQIEFIAEQQAVLPVPEGTYRVCERDLRAREVECESVDLRQDGTDYVFQREGHPHPAGRIRVRTLPTDMSNEMQLYLVEKGIHLAVAYEQRNDDGSREFTVLESSCSRVGAEGREVLIEAGVLYPNSNGFACRVRPDADTDFLARFMMESAVKSFEFTVN